VISVEILVGDKVSSFSTPEDFDKSTLGEPKNGKSSKLSMSKSFNNLR
jgi:hypothetical protein